MKQDIPYEDMYTLTNTDELTEYMWLKPSITTLDYDIFVDDGEAYVRGNHPLLIFVRNGKNMSINEFIPISVSNNSQILDNNIVTTLSPEELYIIRSFIITNKELLETLSHGKLLPDEFVDKLITSNVVIY